MIKEYYYTMSMRDTGDVLVSRRGGLRALVDTAVTRILDCLVESGGACSMSEISRRSDVSWLTVYRIIPRLVSLGVIAEEERRGKSRLFRLNDRSRVAQIIAELSREMGQVEVT